MMEIKLLSFTYLLLGLFEGDIFSETEPDSL